MKYKKIIPLTALTMTLLGACAGGSSQESKVPASSGGNPSSLAPSSGGNPSSLAPSSGPTSQGKPNSVTFDFWHTFGQGIEEGVQARAEEFQELIMQNEGVDVTVNLSKEGSYTDILKKITTGIGTGNAPTLAVAYPDHVAQYISNESTPGQFVVDLTNFINSEEIGFGKEEFLGDKKGSVSYDKNDFVKMFYNEGESYINEGIYSIPLMKSTEVAIYNLDMVQKAMSYIDPEIAASKSKVVEYMNDATWEEFMAIGQAILDHKDEVEMFNDIEYPIYYDSDSNLFISSMYQKEIPYSSIQNKKGHIDFDKDIESGKYYDATKEMCNYFIKAHKDGLLQTKGVNNGEYGSYSFQDYKCAITIGSSGGAGYNAPQVKGGMDVQVAPPPYFNDNPLYVNQGVTLTMLNVVSETKESNYWKQYYAWKFIKYLTNPDVNAEICIEDSQGYVPVRYSAYESDAFLEWLDMPETIMIQSAKTVMSINLREAYYTAKSFKGGSDLRDQCGNVLTRMMINGDDPSASPLVLDNVLDEAIAASKAKMA